MSLLKNGVGRPPKDLLKKRKVLYIGTVVILIATMIISGYLIITKFNGNLNSDNKNAKVPSKPSIGLYKGSVRSSNKYKAGSWTNKNVIATASSGSYGRKYYQYQVIGAMKKSGKGSQVTISKNGTSKIRFRTCFYGTGKCSGYGSYQTIRIDKSKPSNPSVVIKGKYATVTCSDGVSPVFIKYENAYVGKKVEKYTKQKANQKTTKFLLENWNQNSKIKCADSAGNITSKVIYKKNVLPPEMY